MISRRVLIASIIATTGLCEDDCGHLCRTDPNCGKGSYNKKGICHGLFFLPHTGRSEFCVLVLETEATCLSSFETVSLEDATNLLADETNLLVEITANLPVNDRKIIAQFVSGARPVTGMDRDDYYEWRHLATTMNPCTVDDYYEWRHQQVLNAKGKPWIAEPWMFRRKIIAQFASGARPLRSVDEGSVPMGMARDDFYEGRHREILAAARKARTKKNGVHI